MVPKKTKGLNEITKIQCNGQNCALALISRFTRLERKLYRGDSGGEQEAVDDGARIYTLKEHTYMINMFPCQS